MPDSTVAEPVPKEHPSTRAKREREERQAHDASDAMGFGPDPAIADAATSTSPAPPDEAGAPPPPSTAEISTPPIETVPAAAAPAETRTFGTGGSAAPCARRAILEPEEFAERFFSSNPTLARGFSIAGERFPAKACAEACIQTYEAYLLTISKKFRDNYCATHTDANTGKLINPAFVPNPETLRAMYEIATK